MNVTILNLTPHDITVQKPDGSQVVFPRSGKVARVDVEYYHVGDMNGIPVYGRRLRNVTDLPDPRDGVVYLVSSMVLDRVRGRPDVIAPDTGPTAIRNADGQIVAVTRFVGPVTDA